MRTRRRFEHGVTLVESMLSLAILAFGMVGVMQLQIISVRSNTMSRRMAMASALATDLAENVGLWPYTDPRLATAVTVTSTSDAQINAQTDLGRQADLSRMTSKPQFSEMSGANSSNPGALGSYDGYSADTDGDGAMDYERYWSVYKLDPNSDGVEDGKIIVITVRWKEAPIGYRQFRMSTFRSNAGGVLQ